VGKGAKKAAFTPFFFNCLISNLCPSLTALKAPPSDNQQPPLAQVSFFFPMVHYMMFFHGLK